MYLVLGLLSAAENILPILPADTAVALGAFLSHRGVTVPLAVFLVVWISNILGATAVYLASRRYGRRLFATGAGRRLLTPRSLAVIEREYLRFGGLGIFISRLLPGVRAVVPPFVGLADLSLFRAITPIALASGLWYGAITLLGALLGSQWNRITAAVASANRVLAIVSIVLVVAVAIWYLVRRRRAEGGPVWRALARALSLDASATDQLAEPELAAEDPLCHAAVLLLELVYTDEALTAADRSRIADDLRRRWQLAPSAEAPEEERRREWHRLTGYAGRLAEVARADRLALVERLWTVALALPEHPTGRDRLLALAGELLGLSASEVATARERSTGEVRP